MSAHRLTTYATIPVLTAGEIRHYRRIDDGVDDSELDTLITRSTRWCENYCQRAFITQTWTLTLDGFGDCTYMNNGMIYVPRPPLIGVSSIAYLDTAGTSQTWSSSLYRVDATSEPGRIEPAYGQTYPTTRGVTGDVTITHTCGYGAAASAVPGDIKQAIVLLVGHWYENREAVLVGTISKQVEFSVESLLEPYVYKNYA